MERLLVLWLSSAFAISSALPCKFVSLQPSPDKQMPKLEAMDSPDSSHLHPNHVGANTI